MRYTPTNIPPTPSRAVSPKELPQTATNTSTELIASLRWCQASAARVEESINRPKVLENSPSQALIIMVSPITTSTQGPADTGSGLISRPTDDFMNSKPITPNMMAIIKVAIYSARPWP